jgi:hypothetical protein
MVERNSRSLDEPFINEEIDQFVAGIPKSILVFVTLIWIGEPTVVARVPCTIPICVCLIGVRCRETVVGRV